MTTPADAEPHGPAPVRVLLVDDEPMVCAHLTAILGASETIVVVGEAHDGAEAVEQAARHRPDVVLRALGLGASGFLLKSTAPEDLVRLVGVAARGHSVLSPEATARLVAASTGPRDVRGRAAAPVSGLAERETEVLAALGCGLSNAAIGARLHLSEATVKGYVSALMVKIGCENRTQAGLLAYAAGLVDPEVLGT